MGLFRKGGGGSGEGLVVEAAAAIPDYGYNQGHQEAVGKSSELQKTTCYPAEMGGRAKFTAHERTTSYQQASVYNRRTYDTIN
ncbi:MAG TPA: hypothetical protein VHA57_08470 [Actinomycetota bacterium]|nr:hypothetical protein [Actinomycetota bacterium]